MERKKPAPRKGSMKDRLRNEPRADVSKSHRKFADQHPAPNDHTPEIVKPGTGAQAEGQVTRS